MTDTLRVFGIAIVATFGAWLFPVSLAATTVIVVVTRHGVFVGSDSKFTKRAADFSATGQGTTEKIILIQDRIAVVDIGVSDIRYGVNHYNFLTWIRSLIPNLPADVSVEDFVGILDNESYKVFATFDALLKNGTVKQEQPDETCQSFIQYIIAGYQKGIPALYEVRYDIDWNRKVLVGPTPILLDPEPHATGAFRVHMLGIKEAIEDATNEDSYAYKRLKAKLPKTFGALLSDHDVSNEQTVNFVRTLIQIEESTNPNQVGGEIQVVKILPSGNAQQVSGKQ